MSIFTKVKKTKQPMDQCSQILRSIRESGSRGVENWQLARISLKYSSRIAELRADGYNIIAVRQHLPNGRLSGTWKYFLNEG